MHFLLTSYAFHFELFVPLIRYNLFFLSLKSKKMFCILILIPIFASSKRRGSSDG